MNVIMKAHLRKRKGKGGWRQQLSVRVIVLLGETWNICLRFDSTTSHATVKELGDSGLVAQLLHSDYHIYGLLAQ